MKAPPRFITFKSRSRKIHSSHYVSSGREKSFSCRGGTTNVVVLQSQWDSHTPFFLQRVSQPQEESGRHRSRGIVWRVLCLLLQTALIEFDSKVLQATSFKWALSCGSRPRRSMTGTLSSTTSRCVHLHKPKKRMILACISGKARGSRAVVCDVCWAAMVSHTIGTWLSDSDQELFFLHWPLDIEM